MDLQAEMRIASGGAPLGQLSLVCMSSPYKLLQPRPTDGLHLVTSHSCS